MGLAIHRRRYRVGFLLGAWLVATSLACTSSPAGDRGFSADVLSDGVWLFRPDDSQGDLHRVNSLVVRQASGLIVVNAQPSPKAAKLLLKAIGREARAPVRYVVLPHSRPDAVGGWSAFGEDVILIGTGALRRAVEDESYPFGEVRNDEEIRRPKPTLVIDGPTELADAERPVSLWPIQHSYSVGDLLVSVGGVYYLGAMLPGEAPPEASEALPSKWVATLNGVVSRRPDQLIPLLGPAGDARSARVFREHVNWLRYTVEQAFVDEIPSAGIVDHVMKIPEVAERYDLENHRDEVRVLADRVVYEEIEFRKRRGFETP